MIFKLTGISIILLITTLINLLSTVLSWQRRKSKGGWYFVLGMLGITFWTLAQGFDYAAVQIPLKVLFAKFEYTAYNVGLTFLAIFVLVYADYESWLKKNWVKALFIIVPSSTILLAWTNDLHGQLWSGFIKSETGDNSVIFQHGPGFVWAAACGYVMILVILFGLWQAARRGSEISKRQARLLFAASLFPVIANIIYLLVSQKTSGIDWTSVTFSVSGFCFLIALYSTHFLNLVPIARNSLIEWMTDAVVVSDGQNRLVDFNQSAEDIFGITKQQLGSPIQQVMAHWPEFAGLFITRETQTSHVVILHADGQRVFDSTLTLIVDNRGQVFGKMVVFRNITRRYQIEKALEQRLIEIQELHDNLQQTQAQLVEQQRTHAKMEERQRMARNLHDSLSQSIHSLVLFTETLVAVVDKGNIERVKQIVDRLQESARQSHKETRLMLYELQSSGTDRSTDFVRDLENRLSIVERHTGVKAQVIQEGSFEFCPRDWYENLYWIAIEALNNALKHAQARNVRVVLRCTPKMIEMEVIDDGKGFDTAKMHAGGLGLQNLQTRADQLGGCLSIESELTKGTCVRFRAEYKEK